ncbi:MAG: NosD domain-containing protein [Candidatus Bathyarchaeia archaeon]
MRTKIASGILMALLLASVQSLVLNAPRVKAWNGSTVYIQADGSVAPTGAPIQQTGNVYTLTDDIISDSDGIVVQINAITIDGNGHTVQGSSSGNGVDLTSTSDVTVENLTVSGFSIGIFAPSVNFDTITGNNLEQNSFGIWLDSSSNSNVYFNNIRQNGNFGIWLSSSHDNNVYHNNFVNNAQHVYTTYDSFNDTWDDGYPAAGNYWSDYTGQDLYRGPSQNVTGSDGIGDTPYVLDQNNLDNYPLMKPYPWNSHDIGVTYVGKVWYVYFRSVFPLKTVIGLGLALSINVFVMNYGSYAEVFNVTIYANSTTIDKASGVTLAARTSIVLNFTWHTTGFAESNYTMSVYATPVPGETDTTDNNFIDGQALVTIPGDINGDFKVSLADLSILAKAYGSRPGDAKWNPNADIDGNGVVGLPDLTALAKHYGQHYP